MAVLVTALALLPAGHSARLEGTLTVTRGGGDPPPDVPAFLITLRDLTEQERTAQMRCEFITNASHELRTPLASLLGFIDTLRGAGCANDETGPAA